MKNLLKSGMLLLGMTIAVASCSSCGEKLSGGSQEKTDSPKTAIDTTKKTIDTAKKAGTDALKKDTVKK